MYLYIHVYLNVPGICLKPPVLSPVIRVPLCSRARVLFFFFFSTLAKNFSFSFHQFSSITKEQSLSQSQNQRQKASDTSLVFSLFSLSRVDAFVPLFFFCFCFFCFVTSQIFLWLSALFFLIFTHARNTHAFATPH